MGRSSLSLTPKRKRTLGPDGDLTRMPMTKLAQARLADNSKVKVQWRGTLIDQSGDRINIGGWITFRRR